MEAGITQQPSGRRIVAYFDHEFVAPSLAKLENDIDEIRQGGFTNVVLCVTESDCASPARQRYLGDMVEAMRQANLTVWADPWAVGGVFGGEGASHFRESGQVCCDHNPALEPLLDRWLDVVAASGIDTVFWDEPEMHCALHRNDELRFLDKYTRKAGALALRNVVCLCANDKKRGQLREVAALPQVAEIATDPYYPNAFRAVSERDRLEYVADWAAYTHATAAEFGKQSHLWVQTFDIPRGREAIIGEHIAVARDEGIDVAIWGFRGCESVPDFIKPGQASPRRTWSTAIGALALAA